MSPSDDSSKAAGSSGSVTPEKVSVGGQGIANSTYAKTRGQLMSLSNELRSSGASLEIDVPRIVVIGNQSAGKSSLVEAISGINVPRDVGTCTRCPLEVRLQQSTLAWTAKVSLRFEVNANGTAIESVLEVPFGPVLTDPSLVEDLLRRAQLAILNPSLAPQVLLDLTPASLQTIRKGATPSGSSKQLSFSTNVVCISIAGPQVTDLAFLDLPGIISNSGEGGDDGDITLIEDLVKKSITGNCLILLALTMKDDVENQSAGRLSRQADPSGKRTIGVLTKADCASPGEHNRWFEILNGQRYRLKHGYFCTKQPGKADLDTMVVTFADARAAEMRFFSTSPWSTLDTDARGRLGTSALTDFLSERLASFISDKLPAMHLSISTSTNEVQQALDALPPPPSSDPALELHELIHTFCNSVLSCSQGAPGAEELVQGALDVYEQFRLDIRATEPMFSPFERFRQKESTSFVSPSSIQEELASGDPAQDAPAPAPTELVSLKTRAARLAYVVTEGSPVLEMDLDEVRESIKKARTRELPLNTPYGTKTSLILESLKSWQAIIDRWLGALRPKIFKVVESLVSLHFGRFDRGDLRSIVSVAILEVVDSLFRTCEAHLRWLIDLDSAPYTLNSHYLSSTRAGLAAKFNAARSKEMPWVDKSVEVTAVSALTQLGYNVTAKDFAKLLDPDVYEEEIAVMAEVQAYWRVAYKRIIDDVPRALDTDIIRKLPDKVLDALVKAVGLSESDGTARAAALMSENLEDARAREELLKRKKRLESARLSLASFGAGSK